MSYKQANPLSFEIVVIIVFSLLTIFFTFMYMQELGAEDNTTPTQRTNNTQENRSLVVSNNMQSPTQTEEIVLNNVGVSIYL